MDFGETKAILLRIRYCIQLVSVLFNSPWYKIMPGITT